MGIHDDPPVTWSNLSPYHPGADVPAVRPNGDLILLAGSEELEINRQTEGIDRGIDTNPS